MTVFTLDKFDCINIIHVKHYGDYIVNFTVNMGQPAFEAMANVVKKVHEILEDRNDHNGRNLLLASYIHYTCSLPHPGLVQQCKYYCTSRTCSSVLEITNEPTVC